MFRSVKHERVYRKYRKNLAGKDCDFCDVGPHHAQFVGETKSFKIIRNKFPYSTWDVQDVADHLMLVPKKHIDHLAALSPIEAQEYMTIISQYELQGYSVYARAPNSKAKSVVHQHTHFIKTRGPIKRAWFGFQKPYIQFTI